MGTCAADSTLVEIWREHPPSSYSLKINKISKLNSDIYKSRRFLSRGYNWVFKLNPNCFSTSNGKWISIFFYLADNEKLKSDERIYTHGVLRVLDPYGSNHATEKFVCWHDDSNLGPGHDQIFSMAKLREAYLDKEDTLSVEIEFEVVSSTIYSSTI